MVLFTKEIMDADKPVLVVNLPPLSFLGGPTQQRITGSIQGYWDPERLVTVVTTVGVLVEEALADIGMNSRKVVVRMERYGEAS